MHCFELWYCTAFMQFGGLFEATAPYGFLTFMAAIIFLGLHK